MLLEFTNKVGEIMSENLTEKEQRILTVIKSTVSRKGYPPSVREIGEAVGLSSSSTVHGYLKKLEDKGYLRRDSNKTRAIEVISPDGRKNTAELIDIPVLGQVAAGLPLLAEENWEDTFTLPAFFAGTGDFFMLTVKGDSMIEAGILNGDMVLVRQQPSANNGDIVVALLGDEATVKRYYKEKGRVRLQPENKAFEPIYTKDAKLLGKVTGLLRKI